jgi:hypothetical protein
VIHPSSVAVSREHRRAKTDRLDTELLKRGFLGWLRGERGHCRHGARANVSHQAFALPVRPLGVLFGNRPRREWFEVANAQPGQSGLYPVHNARASGNIDNSSSCRAL